MIITHKLEMDLADRGATQKIDVVQGDTNTRVLELTLLSGGEVWNVPEGVEVWMRYSKSDGTKGIYDTLPDGSCAWTVSGNLVTVALAPQMLTAAGTVLSQVELVEGTSTIGTFTIWIAVEQNPAAGALSSEDYINMLQWIEEQMDMHLEEAKASGEFTGPQGEPGPQGESAYAYALRAGYEGTEEAFGKKLIAPCLELSGGTMEGVIQMNGNTISGLAEPQENTDAATKAYVDSRRIVLDQSLAPSGWNAAAPFSQSIVYKPILATDLPRIVPVYTGNATADLQIKAAFDLISYVSAGNGSIRIVCLESRPTVVIPVRIEIMR